MRQRTGSSFDIAPETLLHGRHISLIGPTGMMLHASFPSVDAMNLEQMPARTELHEPTGGLPLVTAYFQNSGRPEAGQQLFPDRANPLKPGIGELHGDSFRLDPPTSDGIS